jgi:hypothetical protein
MKHRLAVLKKIEAVYSLVEELDSIALRQATAKMHEADAAIREQLVHMRAARNTAHAALGSGNRENWALAEVQRTLADETRQRLESLKVQRAVAVAEARVLHQASRMRREQVKSVVEGSMNTEKVLEGRQTQAIADDRFLSRMHWNKLRLVSI